MKWLSWIDALARKWGYVFSRKAARRPARRRYSYRLGGDMLGGGGFALPGRDLSGVGSRRTPLRSPIALEQLEERICLSTFFVTTSKNWSALGAVTNLDTVVIEKGATLTVNVADAVAGSLIIGSSGGPDAGNGTLSFSAATSQLTVGGFVELGGATGQTGTVNMTSGGSLITAGFAETVGHGAITLNTSNGNVTFTANNTTISAFTSVKNDDQHRHDHHAERGPLPRVGRHPDRGRHGYARPQWQ